MEWSLKDHSAADSFVEAAGSREAGRYTVKSEELLWLLTSGQKRGASELELLKAVQRALPQPDDEAGTLGELKGLLTNAIIMRTRLGEREADLAVLLERAVGEGLLDGVEVDEDVVRRLAGLMADGGERLHCTAGT